MNQNGRHDASPPRPGPPGGQPRRRTAWPALLVPLAAWLQLTLGGCAGPGYYAQAISGHLRLMRARVDADEVLARADGDPELAASLRLAESILAFGRGHLDLPASDSYRKVVVTGREAVTWNVVAAPEFSVEPRRWCFPFAGCVPYRGYFERRRAEAFAARRVARGDDVLVSPATAYSTLGWFDDPLLDTMFRYGDAELAAVLFHELAHQKLYVRGDTAFNEAYATFVASAGLQRWAAATGRSALFADWARRQQAARAFNELLQATQRKLRALYGAALDTADKRARKRELFDDLRAQYRRLVDGEWAGADYFAGWMSGELNNAHLALMQQYQGGDCAFAALFREAGEDFTRFHALAGARSRLPAEARKQWLETRCTAFASAPDL
jgi:predicted aminopeptidase